VEEIRRVLKPSGVLVWNLRQAAAIPRNRTMAEHEFETVRRIGRYRSYTLQKTGKFDT